MDDTARLVQSLMDEYDVPLERVIRHYDVTGKNCPGVYGWTDPDTEWQKFKGRLTTVLEDGKPYRVRKSWADVKSQIGAFSVLENAKALAAKNAGYHVYDKTGKEII